MIGKGRTTILQYLCIKCRVIWEISNGLDPGKCPNCGCWFRREVMYYER